MMLIFRYTHISTLYPTPRHNSTSEMQTLLKKMTKPRFEFVKPRFD